MVAINQENVNTTLYKLNNIEVPFDPMGRRVYLGMSGTGGKCMRAQQYSFRWCAKIGPMTNRTRRIFERGNMEESRIIYDLDKIGIKVYKEVDGVESPLTGELGEEQETITGFAGHILGHPDGRCIGVPESPKTIHLLEMKTANVNNFKKFQTAGCKATNGVYYGQCQNYMGELGLTRALFIVINKNTEEYYIERLEFDKDFFDELKRKEMAIITTENLFPKLSGFDVKMNCNWCGHLNVCKNEATPNVSCRTCQHIEVHNKGEWKCGLDSDDADPRSKEEQIMACNLYEVAKWLI